MRIATCVLVRIMRLAVLMAASASLAAAQESTQLVTALYKAHNTKNVATWSRVSLKKYFTPGLASAIYKAAHKPGGIGFDILYRTRDISGIIDLKIVNEDSHYESDMRTVYTLSATFKNKGKADEIYFTIDPDGWKIEDVRYAKTQESLLDMLKH